MRKYFYVLLLFTLSFFLSNYFVNKKNKIISEINSKWLHHVEMAKENAEHNHNVLHNPYTGKIPENIRMLENEFLKRHQKKHRLSKITSNIKYNWEEAGPIDVGGRTRAIGIDQQNRYVLAGGVSGGIWKSTDNGNSWKLKTKSINTLNVSYLKQDPREGFQNIWYCGTGEFSLGLLSDHLASSLTSGTGIYISEDHGETWVQIQTSTFNHSTLKNTFAYISEIVIDSRNGHLYVASNEGVIYKSTDKGKTFTSILGSNGGHFYTSIDISENGTLLAVLSEFGLNKHILGKPSQSKAGVYKSTNEGETWTNITPIDFPGFHQKSIVRISKSNPDVGYILTTDGNVPDNLWFYKINISDNKFENRSQNIPDYSAQSVNGRFITWSSYCFMMEIKPDDENFVIIGGINLYRSTDGFATYPSDIRFCWFGGYIVNANKFYSNHHPDQQVAVFNPTNPNELWSGHDGGISVSENITDSSNFHRWQSKNNQLNITQYYKISIHPDKGNGIIIGGTQDNGTPAFKFENKSTSKSDMILGGDGYACYLGRDFVLTSYNFGKLVMIEYLNNGFPGNALTGNTKSSLIFPRNARGQQFFCPIAVNPNDEDVLFYASGKQTWRTTTLGSFPWATQNGLTFGWDNISGLSVGDGYQISAMKFSNLNSMDVLYIGASSPNDKSYIYRVDNASSSKEISLKYIFNELPAGCFIYDIAVNKLNSNEILVLFSNYGIEGTWYSNNGGETFECVEGNLNGTNGPSIRTAAIIQIDEVKKYFLGTSIGLFYTDQLNGHETEWLQENSNGIGNVVIPHLTSRISDNTIGVATFGRGIFMGTLEKTTNTDIVSNTQYNFSLKQNFPNPFNPTTVISYRISEVSFVELRVYDMLGREVATLVNNYQKAGNYEIDFNASHLASGTYIYSIKTDDFSDSKKMILIK